MSLRDIKNELEKLCYDLQGEDLQGEDEVRDYRKRISAIYQMVIHDPGWIEKNAHFRLKACQALWKANGAEPDCWQINKADGWMEEAIKVDAAERLKGIPKPLKCTAQSEEGTSKWIDSLKESETEYTTSEDLYIRYKNWMEEEAPNDEILNQIALGRRLGMDGLQRTTKRIGDKTTKVWKVVVPA